SVPELQEIIGRLRPGSKIEIKYWRNKKQIETEAILKNQANTTSLISARRDPILLDLGFEVRDLTDIEKALFKESGVKVLSIYQGSIIESTNMAPNYIITSVNGKKVQNSDDFIKYLKETDKNVLLNGFYEKYKGRFPYRFNKN
ncbi:MAG: protease Do, partial [Saprospiraceae bacterium]